MSFPINPHELLGKHKLFKLLKKNNFKACKRRNILTDKTKPNLFQDDREKSIQKDMKALWSQASHIIWKIGACEAADGA